MPQPFRGRISNGYLNGYQDIPLWQNTDRQMDTVGLTSGSDTPPLDTEPLKGFKVFNIITIKSLYLCHFS